MDEAVVRAGSEFVELQKRLRTEHELARTQERVRELEAQLRRKGRQEVL